MNAEALSRSLSDLPDSMIGEAIVSRAKMRIYHKTWFRAAACIAVVLGLLFGISFPWLAGEKYITAPSILAVKAYAFENGQPKEYELEEGVRFYHTDPDVLDYYPGGLNCVPGLPVTFAFDGDDITLDITVDKGYFIDGNYDISGAYFVPREDNGILGCDFTVKNNRTIYWKSWEYNGKGGMVTGNTYVDIILKQDSRVVGYMVIRFEHLWSGAYKAFLVKSVYYPMVDGQHQAVTEEYVRQQMKIAKWFQI